MEDNIILLTDSYKLTHWKQYPKGTEKVYSYFESRGGKYDKTLFFGLQYIIKKYLTGKVITKEKIEQAYKFSASHFGNADLFNYRGWIRLLEKHQGILPVSIKSVPEGMKIPTSNILMSIENTDKEFPWITNFLETLLVQTWYPTTVATISYEIKQIILKYLEETGTPELIDFKLHDFGFRGVSSVESSAIGGLAHLVNFKGSDTISAILLGQGYYSEDMAGFSVPASEHSTITSWGKDHEVDAMENMLDQYPSGIVACVSDSFDIYKACQKYWGEKLKDKILKRNGILVVRPDSGDFLEVILKILNILWDAFDGTINSKGFKVLHPNIRIIQGDGVEYDSILMILDYMKASGWSADNITFGMGGALLQKLNRDTQKFAFKCSEITINNQSRDVFKSPITDSGKKSKAGRLKLVMIEGENGNYPKTLRQEITSEKDILTEVFRNGNILKEYSLEEVRNNAKLNYN